MEVIDSDSGLDCLVSFGESHIVSWIRVLIIIKPGIIIRSGLRVLISCIGNRWA